MKRKPAIKLGFAFFMPLLFALVFSLGCGRFTSNGSSSGGGGGSPLLAVADAANNRVVIFDSSLATGESASIVLGQADFTHSGFGTTATTLDNPAGAKVDGSGNLYVTDQSNCRVLQFVKPFSTNMAATLALGQPNLVTGTCPNGQLSTAIALGSSPGGVAIDSSGNVWVADSYYSRVVEYLAPVSTSENATMVLGQTALFGTNGGSMGCNQNLASPTAKTLCFPSGLAFDGTGNLWVVDNGNNRVLMFPKASLTTSTIDPAATVEFGQPAATAFTSGTGNNGGVTASSLNLPLPSVTSTGFGGIAFDASGDLWVSDTNNNRVLMHTVGNLGADGAPASVELGQPSASAFTSNAINNPTLGAGTLNHPFGLAFDGSGNLIVGDTANNRVLVFSPTFSSGMGAGLVLGQSSFASSAINTTQTGLSGPVGVAILP